MLPVGISLVLEGQATGQQGSGLENSRVTMSAAPAGRESHPADPNGEPIKGPKFKVRAPQRLARAENTELPGLAAVASGSRYPAVTSCQICSHLS